MGWVSLWGASSLVNGEKSVPARSGPFQGSPWGELSAEPTERGYLKNTSTVDPLSVNSVRTVATSPVGGGLDAPSADGGDGG